MKKALKEIIESSTFAVMPGRYVYAKAAKVPNLSNCFMISKDKDEITAIVEESNIRKIDVIEKNKDLYKLIELKVSLPFYAVGFLAAVTNAISAEGMNNLVISTYSKDYLLVRVEHEQKAREVLLRLGLRE